MTPLDATGVSWHRLGVAETEEESELTPLGKRIKEAYLARGWTLNEANRACGFQDGYLSRVARGERKNPRSDTMLLIAAALNVRLDWLMTGSGRRDLGVDLSREQLDPWTETAVRIWVGRGKSKEEVLKGVREIPFIYNTIGIKPLVWVEYLQQYFDGTLPRDPAVLERADDPVEAMRVEAANFYWRRHGGGKPAAMALAERVELKDPSSLRFYEAMLELAEQKPAAVPHETGDDFSEKKPTKRRAKKA